MKITVNKATMNAIAVFSAVVIIISSVVAGVFIAMNNAALDTDSALIIGNSTKLIAHRGYSSIYYQNSEAAYLKAAEEEAFYGIECDIWRTKDGVWVTSHDDNPFSDMSKTISKSTYEEIKDLELRRSNAGKGVLDIAGHTICTLERYLEICAVYDKLAVIELKPRFKTELLQQLSEFVKARSQKYVYISFVRDNLYELHNIDADNNLMYLAHTGIDAINHMERGYDISVNHSFSDIGLVIDEGRKKMRATNFWTVNNEDTLKRLFDLGADYVTTDIIPSFLL